MKKMIFSIAFLAVSAAMACPGGDLRMLKYNGAKAFVLNVATGKIDRITSNKDIALVALFVNGNQICGEVGGSKVKCSKVFPQKNIITLDEQNVYLSSLKNLKNVQAQLAGKDGVKLATIDNFAVARGGCGQEIEAQ